MKVFEDFACSGPKTDYDLKSDITLSENENAKVFAEKSGRGDSVRVYRTVGNTTRLIQTIKCNSGDDHIGPFKVNG